MSAHSARSLLASLVAVVVLISTPSTAAAQDEQELIALAWVEAFNGGVEAMATFRASHAGEPERAGWRDQFGTMRQNWGQLEIRGVMIDQMNEVIVGLGSENEGRMRLVFVFNDANKLGSGKEMVEGLTNLIAIFENPALDFSTNRADGDDILGDAYEYLMRQPSRSSRARVHLGAGRGRRQLVSDRRPAAEGWLCPALFKYFEDAPGSIYVRAAPKG